MTSNYASQVEDCTDYEDGGEAVYKVGKKRLHIVGDGQFSEGTIGNSGTVDFEIDFTDDGEIFYIAHGDKYGPVLGIANTEEERLEIIGKILVLGLKKTAEEFAASNPSFKYPVSV